MDVDTAKEVAAGLQTASNGLREAGGRSSLVETHQAMYESAPEVWRHRQKYPVPP